MSAHKTAPEPVQGATAAADIFYGSWTLLLLLLLLAPDRRTFYPGTFRRVFSLAPQLRFFFLRRTTPLHHPSLTNTLAGLNQYQTTSRHPAAFHFSLCMLQAARRRRRKGKEKKRSANQFRLGSSSTTKHFHALFCFSGFSLAPRTEVFFSAPCSHHHHHNLTGPPPGRSQIHGQTREQYFYNQSRSRLSTFAFFLRDGDDDDEDDECPTLAMDFLDLDWCSYFSFCCLLL